MDSFCVTKLSLGDRTGRIVLFLIAFVFHSLASVSAKNKPVGKEDVKIDSCFISSGEFYVGGISIRDGVGVVKYPEFDAIMTDECRQWTEELIKRIFIMKTEPAVSKGFKFKDGPVDSDSDFKNVSVYSDEKKYEYLLELNYSYPYGYFAYQSADLKALIELMSFDRWKNYENCLHQAESVFKNSELIPKGIKPINEQENISIQTEDIDSCRIFITYKLQAYDLKLFRDRGIFKSVNTSESFYMSKNFCAKLWNLVLAAKKPMNDEIMANLTDQEKYRYEFPNFVIDYFFDNRHKRESYEYLKYSKNGMYKKSYLDLFECINGAIKQYDKDIDKARYIFRDSPFKPEWLSNSYLLESM